MIVEWFLKVVASLFEWLFSPLPAYTPPDWVSSLAGAVGQVFSMAHSMGVWFPAPLVLTILAALLVIWTFSYGVHIVRMIVSALSGGGGKA